MERIKLNLIPSGVAPVVHVSQYDEGREFACDLFEGANVYTLDGTETLTVQVRKPDGHLVTESVTNTSDSYIVVTTTEQMCAVHGTNLANLKIEKGSIEIASLNFLMEVERDPLENGDPSESFVDNLNTQIYNAVADQYDSNNVIFDNAPTAGHNQPYTVTSDGIKTALDAKANTADLATVATSGDYDDLTNKPTIPVNIGDLGDVNINTPQPSEILVFDNDGNLVNQANPASTANFAPDYDDTQTYNTNDKVIYQGLLYVCNADNVTGTWDAQYWDSFTTADFSVSNLKDTDIQNPASGEILQYNGSEWENSNALDDKQDYIANGTYTIYGVWGDSYYGNARMYFPFLNADKYTITVTGAKYRSDNNTMTSLSSPSLIAQSAVGLMFGSGGTAAALHWGEVTFTLAKT